MLLFRSEQHVERWCAQWKQPRGGTLTLPQGWRLAQEWYGNRLSPDWRPKTVPEAQAAFASIGLAGEFWRLAEAKEKVLR
ncbi:MAG: alkylmercury lyase family protein [Acidobacteriia bacterium]|nr:alkylmercury lyase family protein [Terriglobia bacterium]